MTVKTRAAAAGGSVLLIGLLSGCGAGGTGDPSETPGPSPRPTPSENASTDRQVPEGSYTKVATVDEGIGMGLDAALVGDVLGPDGEMPLELVFRDGTWEHHVTNDAGIAELGDLGTYSYDDAGRIVMVSESDGCPGCTAAWEWSFDSGVLTLSPTAPAELEPIQRLHTAGDWTANAE